MKRKRACAKGEWVRAGRIAGAMEGGESLMLGTGTSAGHSQSGHSSLDGADRWLKRELAPPGPLLEPLLAAAGAPPKFDCDKKSGFVAVSSRPVLISPATSTRRPPEASRGDLPLSLPYEVSPLRWRAMAAGRIKGGRARAWATEGGSGVRLRQWKAWGKKP